MRPRLGTEPRDGAALWARHDTLPWPIDNESPLFADITGDGVPELVHMSGGVLGTSSPGVDPTEPWVFRALTENRGYGAFTHGLGAGDVNGDGASDLVEASGYFTRSPESPDGLPFTRRAAVRCRERRCRWSTWTATGTRT